MTDEGLRRLTVALFGEDHDTLLGLAALMQVPDEKRVGLTPEQELDLVAEVMLDWHENPEKQDSANSELNGKICDLFLRVGPKGQWVD